MSDLHEYVWDIAAPLLVAMLLGGLIGLDREVKGRWAGLRTHMLVAMGAALFMAIGLSLPSEQGSLSRVMQGIAAGVGFIGAGTILKLTDRLEIKGLTTASSIWFAAAAGTAAGARLYALAITGTCIALVILTVLGWLERWCTAASSLIQTDGDTSHH